MALDLQSYFQSLAQPSPQPPAPGGKWNVTPDQAKSMYDYAQSLLNQSQSAVPGTKGGWTVGAQHMVDALVGGNQAYQAAQLQKQAMRGGSDQFTTGLPNPPTSNGQSDAPSTTQPAPQEGASNYAPQGGSNVLDKAASITKGQESGGDYNNVTTTINPKTGKPQSALGAYGVMDFNVGPWSKEVLGQELSPKEFLGNSVAQDAIYKAKMGQYISQFGPEGAGRAWIGGPGGVTNPQRTDPLGTKVGDYGEKFSKALAFNGQPAPATPDAQSAITMALAKGGAKSAAPNFQTVQAPGPGSSQTNIIPPSVVQPTSTYNKPGLSELLSNPYAGDAQKAMALQMYMGTQVGPRTVPVTGGHVLIGPDGKQYYVPDLQKGTSKLTAGPASIEKPWLGTLGPQGEQPNMAVTPTPVTPAPVAPAAPSQGGALPFAPAGAPPAAPAAPAATPGPQGAITPPPAAPPPVKVASTGPLTGIGGAVPPMGNAGPPSAEPTQPVGPLGAAPPPTPEGTKVAQAAVPPLPPGISPEDASQLKWLGGMGAQIGAQQKAAESAATTPAEHFAKRYDTLVTQGQGAQDQINELKLAQNLVKDPKNVQGLLAQPALFYNKLLDAMGISAGNAAPALVFNKVVSQSILDSLRAFTQGASVGQIRTAEIALARAAAASTSNTPEANMGLLNIGIKMHQRLVDTSKMAEDYAAEHGHLDAGYDKMVTKYKEDNPLFSKDELKNYGTMFNLYGASGTPQGATPAGPAPVVPQGAIDHLKAHPETRDMFEKHWPGQADKYLTPAGQ